MGVSVLIVRAEPCMIDNIKVSALKNINQANRLIKYQIMNEIKENTQRYYSFLSMRE